MTKKKYDFILPMGNACSCTQILRAAGLQHLSFPFDWVIYELADGRSDLLARTDLVTSSFQDWLNRDDLVFRARIDWHPHDIYFNRRTRVLFNHEFSFNADFDAEYPVIKAKYERRINRLYECIRSSKRVLIARIDRPDQSPSTTIGECERALKMLSGKFPGVDFDLLLVSMDASRPLAEMDVSRPSAHIVRLAFDYKDKSPDVPAYAPDIPLAANVLRDRYEVRDYRSKAEIEAKRQAARKEKFKAVGANNAVTYRLIRFRLKALRFQQALALRLSQRILRAKIKSQKFEHIITLGVNCEPAFRFYDTWGFLDSSLLAWSQVFHLEKLVSALNRFPSLFAGDLSLDRLSKMWICGSSGIYVHGKLKAGLAEPPPDAVEADRCDVQGRMRHLKDKFLQYIRDDRPTLFVHRLCEGDEADETLGGKLDALETALSALGAKNWKLLVICEKEFLSRMPPSDLRVFRAVKKFNPGHAITDRKLGDPVGWKAIYTEFAPAKLLPKKHAFKFE